MPGDHTDTNVYIALMNVIYFMSQFVVVVPVPDESSITLAFYSMQHMMMKFCLCHHVTLDDGTPFKGASVAT